MVRFFLTILIIALYTGVWAQQDLAPRCPYPGIPTKSAGEVKEAPDFTITTTDGITRNLYTTLDSGITVFVDLFYTTCHYCQVYAPIIEEVYQNTGAGTGDIQFWGISNNLFDTNWVIDQYKLNYNVTNPCAGPYGGGTTAFSIIVEGQEFYGFPTYCIMCPDRRMYFGICYPPSPECFEPFFAQCAENVGTAEYPPAEPVPDILSVYPNPANENISAEIYLDEAGVLRMEIIDYLGRIQHQDTFHRDKGLHTVIIPAESFPQGMYFIRMLLNSHLKGLQKISIVR